MSEADWMVYRRKSGQAFVSDPRAGAEAIAPALTRYEQAYAALANPKKPDWFHVVSKHWYATYIPPVLASCLIFSAFDLSLGYAVVCGLLLATLIAAVLTSVAGYQARASAEEDVAKVAEADKNRAIRVLPIQSWIAATNILAVDPAQEELVHRLAWSAAGSDVVQSGTERDAATDRLLDLEQRVKQR